MISDKQISKGNDNQQISGDNNSQIKINKVLLINQKSEIFAKPNLIFKLLKVIYNSLNLLEGKWDLTVPAPIQKKLKFNKVDYYEKIFDEYVAGLETISKVMSRFPDSSRIVMVIYRFFIKFNSIENKKKNYSGDEVLEKVFDAVEQYLKKDPGFSVLDITEEQMDDFTYALMLYCVSECKLLKNPNEEEEER